MNSIKRIRRTMIFDLVGSRMKHKMQNARNFDELSDKGIWIELDATSKEKFSRHLIVHLPYNMVFQNNFECGIFVEQLNQKINEQYPVNIQNRFGTRREDFYWFKNVENKKSKVSHSIIDNSVYRKYQCFRLVNSAKYKDLGKRHFNVFNCSTNYATPCSTKSTFLLSLANTSDDSLKYFKISFSGSEMTKKPICLKPRNKIIHNAKKITVDDNRSVENLLLVT